MESQTFGAGHSSIYEHSPKGRETQSWPTLTQPQHRPTYLLIHFLCQFLSVGSTEHHTSRSSLPPSSSSPSNFFSRGWVTRSPGWPQAHYSVPWIEVRTLCVVGRRDTNATAPQPLSLLN